MLMDDNYDFYLEKMSIIKLENYWKILVNIDSQRKILFPCEYHHLRFGNAHIPFHVLKSKFINDYDVAI